MIGSFNEYIKGVRNMNESLAQRHLNAVREVTDAMEMVFANIPDKYYMNINPYYDCIYLALADVSFTVAEERRGDYAIRWEFAISDFKDKVLQFKEYIGPGYEIRYSYKNRTVHQQYIKTFPDMKSAYYFAIHVAKSGEIQSDIQEGMQLESLYTDISSSIKPIIDTYNDFIEAQKIRMSELKSQIEEENLKKWHEMTFSVKDMSKNYLNTIRECMVDLEDYYVNFSYTDVSSAKSICRFEYKSTVGNYDIFIDMHKKLNDILGDGSHNMFFILKEGSQHKVFGLINLSKTIQSLEDFESYIENIPDDKEMLIQFLFYGK